MRYKIEFTEYTKTTRTVEVEAPSQEEAELLVTEFEVEESDLISLEDEERTILTTSRG